MKHGHHVIHPAKEWQIRPEAKKVRDTPSLIVPMGPYAHNKLHRNCPPLPLLGYHALQTVVREFTPTRDTMETLDSLVYAIEQAARHPRAYQVERGVARLAIDALETQRPFLQEALQVDELALFPLTEIPGYGQVA